MKRSRSRSQSQNGDGDGDGNVSSSFKNQSDGVIDAGTPSRETIVRIVKLPRLKSREFNTVSAVIQNKPALVELLPLRLSNCDQGGEAVPNIVRLPQSRKSKEISANIGMLSPTSLSVSTTLPLCDIRLGLPIDIPRTFFVKPTSRVCRAGGGAGGLHILIPSPPPHPSHGSIFQQRSQSPQMPAGGGRVTSLSPIPLSGRSSTPTPGRTPEGGLDILRVFAHVLKLFKRKFPKYFQSLETNTKTKKFTETLTAMLLSASLNERNPMRFHTHPVLVYCMFMRLAEMYLTLRQESTPLDNIVNLIDAAFTRVISGDQLSVWDRMMTIVTELKVQSDNLLAVSKFICDPSKARIVKGHMEALSSLCEQCRMKDRLQNLRTSLHSKVNKMNWQHGIPFWTITSALTWEDFYHYFQSLSLENLAHEYYEVFVACFRVDSSTTSQ